MDYIFYILALGTIYSILAVSLNLLVGFTGILSIAHAAFMSIGAYVTTLIMVHYGVNFFITIPLGVFLAAAISAPVALLSLRIKGDFYVIVSFAAQILFYNILLNWVGLTRGPFGFAGIPMPSIFGFVFDTYWSFLIMSVALMSVCVVFCWRLTKAPFGLVLKAIAEDEVSTAACGKDVAHYRVVIFIIGSATAAVAGSLFAGLIRFIDPFCFTLHESIFMIAIVIIGGARNIWGSVLGAFVLISIPEVLRFFAIPATIAGALRQMIYGALLVIFMLFRPQGLLPGRRGR